MAGSWNQNIKFIQDGERVDANVSGRPDRSLSDRTVYLKDRIDAMDNGQALFAFDVSVESSVLVGQAVYWNDVTQRFEKALASVVSDASGSIVNNKSCEVIGVVHSKTSAVVATLLIAGKAKLDISNAVSGAVSAGRYFLSGTVPGGLDKTQDGLSISVLYSDGNGYVFVQPQNKNLFSESHGHFKIDLYTQAAGTTNNPSVGQKHTITSADSSLPGWLPADDSSFNGLAPYGAAFGYNLAAHPELSKLWPPSPPEYSALVMFFGTDGYGQELPTGTGNLVAVDRNGIWWMSDCYGDVPWSDHNDNYESSQGMEPECPRSAQKKIVFYFSKVRYGGLTAVTSLRTTNANSPLVITNLDGNAAVAGDLKIEFDGGLMVENDTALGSLAFKELSANKFRRGRVVEGVKSANNSLVITSTHSRSDSGETLHQGILTLEANLDGTNRLLIPQVVRLIDVRERYENDIMYLGFPSGIQTSVRYKFKLPGADGFPANGVVKLRLWVTGDANTSSLPAFNVSYRRLARVSTATNIPTTDTNLDWEAASLTGGSFGTVAADQYLEVDTETFSAEESDVVLFTVTRNLNGDDGYAGEIGILDAVAVLSPGI